MARRNDIDWERIERLYVANVHSIREIADECGVSESQVRLRAKQLGWRRDLTDEIRKRARAKVAQLDVKELVEVAARQQSTQSAQTLRAAIESAADVQAAVVLKHRGYITDGYRRCEKLEYAIDGFLDGGSGDEPLSVMDLSRLSQAQKAIIDAKCKLLEKERQAFGMDEEAEKDKADTLPKRADPTLAPADAYMRMLGKK